MEDGLAQQARALAGHFLTSDHGTMTDQQFEYIRYPAWLFTSSDDSGKVFERAKQFGGQELIVACIATGSAAGISDWGGSPGLYVEGSGFSWLRAKDTGVIAYAPLSPAEIEAGLKEK